MQNITISTQAHQCDNKLYLQQSIQFGDFLWKYLLDDILTLQNMKQNCRKITNNEVVSRAIKIIKVHEIHTEIEVCSTERTDIKLRPGIGIKSSPYGPLRPNITSSIKLEVHNVSQRRQRRSKPRPQRICTTNCVKIDPVVPEICSRTDRHTDRQTN